MNLLKLRILGVFSTICRYFTGFLSIAASTNIGVMHFLSHYYTEIPNNNPLFVVALTIPDFTPGFSRIYNSQLKNAPLPDDEKMRAIHNGILRHYEGDKKFHNSDLFMQHCTQAIQSMVDAGLSRQKLRLSVLAHVAVEMLIDRHIILAHPDVCNDFYSCIDNAGEDDLIAFFNLHNLGDQKSSFLAKFHFFKQRRFLYLFNELENIVMGLDRIYGGVTGTQFTVAEKSQFLVAIHNIDGIIRYRWQEILNA